MTAPSRILASMKERRQTYNRIYYDRLKAEGKCVRCRRKAKSRALCAGCLKKLAAASKRWRKNR